MKKLYALGLASFLCSLTSQANIWRVNNQSTSTTVFTNVQAAIDDDRVSNGDTILIEGTSQDYPGFVIDKRLVIMGPGYFLNENPFTSVEGIHAIIQGNAYFDAGSEGSLLQGVIFGNNLNSGYGPDIEVDDVIIQGCNLQNGIDIWDDIKGLVLIQNYFLDDFTFPNSGYSIQGVVLRNNIINTDLKFTTTVNTPRTFAAVENNLFLGSVQLTTSTYRNNIWLPLQQESISVNAGIKEYNVNVSVDMGAENNNSVITGLTELYTGDGSTDGKWQIKADSDYKAAGKDGTDPGPFGGSNPYVLSGLPALPIIYEISTTGFGSTQDGLPLTIKVRAN